MKDLQAFQTSLMVGSRPESMFLQTDELQKKKRRQGVTDLGTNHMVIPLTGVLGVEDAKHKTKKSKGTSLPVISASEIMKPMKEVPVHISHANRANSRLQCLQSLVCTLSLPLTNCSTSILHSLHTIKCKTRLIMMAPSPQHEHTSEHGWSITTEYGL